MTTDTKQLTQPAACETSWLEKVKPHLELIAALFSGVLILLGWALSKNGLETPSIVIYLASFLIGGYAKAKEGIEDT
ncbi:heavy metal translocating P-type ATPase, partial [Peribacillus sp. NPDC060186]